MLKRIETMYDYTVHATDGDVGKVVDFYFDSQTWEVRYIIVDTGPWLFGRQVLLSPCVIEGVPFKADKLIVNLTQEQIKNSPDIDTQKPVSQQQLEELHTYYNWPWIAPRVPAPVAYRPTAAVPPTAIPAGTPKDTPVPDSMKEEVRATINGARDRGDPYLRSSKEVTGYSVQARDGDIGHVEDFLMDMTPCIIRYMLVDTAPWLLGKTVLVATKWANSIHWSESDVYVDLARAAIENSPEYEPTKSIDREFEILLHQHYGRKGYWE